MRSSSKLGRAARPAGDELLTLHSQFLVTENQDGCQIIQTLTIVLEYRVG